MAARKKEKSINLLPKNSFTETTLGRVITWFLGTFRIMVIAVELVVVAAFLSRFWLDSKNADLSDEIKQKQAQIIASKETEDYFRGLQKRIAAFKTFSTQASSPSNALTIITPLVPPTIVLNSINFAEGKINIGGQSPDESELAKLIANLQAVEDFKNTTLTSLKTDTENSNILVFTLEIPLKNQTTQNSQTKPTPPPVEEEENLNS